jgi:sugar phosphate isomerase/epimerase
MKVAISSASSAGALAAGDLTQLEWLEQCASRLGADGVIFDRSHFPRTDPEYLAQLKKISVDLGLVPLAIEAPSLFAPSTETDQTDAIALAAALGVLFVLTVLPAPGEIPPATFVAAVTAAKVAARAAKAANITLLIGIAPGTLGDDVSGLRHFHKDVDSAWLWYALPAGADRGAFNARERALVVTIEPGDDLDALAEVDGRARPWLLLRGSVGAERVAALRRAVARKTLAAAGVL